MRNKVHYEWCCEHTDKHGDILDVTHADKLSDLDTWTQIYGTTPVVCLTRNVGNDDEGLLDRAYAYPNALEFPPEFEDGCRVPEKYMLQWIKFTQEMFNKGLQSKWQSV